ncbi:MAG TPA: CRTAC1 family protein [Saprospiraceae bacterium]
MRNVYYFIGVILFLLSCSSGTEQATSNDKATDTRALVQEAFDRIDPLKLPVAFTTKRVAMIESKLTTETDPGQRLNLSMQYGTELLKLGKTSDAIVVFEKTYDFIVQNNVEIDPGSKRTLMSMTAIAYMRQGEIENCLQHHNHESCFIPIRGQGVHQLPQGSRGAIEWYNRILKEFPDDLDSKYLLNLAYMTLGEYPQKVPAAHRIPPEWFSSKTQFPRFKDISPELSLNRFSLAGGCVMDDFNNDGWLDIVISSWAVEEELIFYLNNGDGTFTDQTEAYGLKGQVACLHFNQTDFNNDGWLDLYLMRGGWWAMAGVDIPHTLLMNTGKGSFVDVTMKAGLSKYACSQASAWADFDLDGWLDLVVANETVGSEPKGIFLYMNQKDGTFKESAAEFGLTMSGYFKGCVASDINNDKYPDIYITDLNTDNRVMVNQIGYGKRSFVKEGPQGNPGSPGKSFPCWSFDYNNDGNEDLFASGYNLGVSAANEWMESKSGKSDPSKFPKLYKNNGNMNFEDVGLAVGLDEVALTMGCNFGDINTDGYLDFYLATGNPLYQSLGPNKMYLNIEGKRFEDVSYVGGFSNIQKGHSVCFGDLDHDGDEDFYVVMGGAYEGDGFYNCLFENPNTDKNNWVTLDISGTTVNKAAIGARVKITVEEGGKERNIWRTVTSGSSFGANSLALEVGLGKATSIKQVNVQWPCKDCPDQVYTGLEINKAYRLEEGKQNAEMLDYGYIPFSNKSGGHHHH